MTANKKLIIALGVAIALLALLISLLSCDSCESFEIAAQSGSDVGDGAHEHASGSDAVSESDGEGHVHIIKNDSGELLIDRESDEQQSVTLTNESGVYHIARDSASGELAIGELSGLPLNTDFIELLWYNTLTIGYSYRIEAEEKPALSDYGLDNPAARVKCVYSDGSAAGFSIGGGVAGNEDIYYFALDGSDEIYITAFDAVFFQGDQYWLSDDIFGDYGDKPAIDNLELSGGTFDGTLKISSNRATDKSEALYGFDYVVTSPVSAAADDYRMSLLTDELSGLLASEAVCARPTAAQLAGYSLDKPYAVISHTRDGRRCRILLAKKDASTIYAKADGADVVYELSAEIYTTLAALNGDYLRSTQIHVRYFETIERISVKAPNIDLAFSVERQPLSTDNTLYEYRAFCGEKQLTLSYYQNLLEVFNGAAAVSYGGKKASDTPAMTVSIEFFDGYKRKSETIEYYPAGTRRYLCLANGGGDGVVGSMWLDKFLEDARKLSANEAVTP